MPHVTSKGWAGNSWDGDDPYGFRSGIGGESVDDDTGGGRYSPHRMALVMCHVILSAEHQKDA